MRQKSMSTKAPAEKVVRDIRRKTPIEREGWTLIQVYSDAAISGATTLRPGYQRLLEDARAGAFDVVVAESLDRLSRDLEDVAAIGRLPGRKRTSQAKLTREI